MALRIGIDAHMLGAQETGNETYVWGLLQGFAAMDPVPPVVVYTGGGAVPPVLRQRRVDAHRNLRRLLVELPRMAREDRLDVLHCTYSAPPRPGVPVVLMVHDVSYLDHPEWFSPRDLLVLRAGVAISVRLAARVITPSEAAREAVLRHYRLDPARVVAIPEAPGPAGPRQPSGGQAETRDQLPPPLRDPRRPFLLAVGAGSARKNLGRLVAAWQALRAAGTDLELVVAGRGSAGIEAGIEAGIGLHLLGRVSDSTLRGLYGAAAAVVVPTLYEGFSLVPLEALAHGVPLAASDIAVHREVCGDLPQYFEAASVPAMTAAITAALATGGAPYADRARAHAARYSWVDTSRRTVEVYEEAASSS